MKDSDLVIGAWTSYGRRWSNIRRGLPPGYRPTPRERLFKHQRRAIEMIEAYAARWHMRVREGSIGEHDTWVKRHNVASCNTARHAKDGHCGTYYEAWCSCGFMQGAGCHEQADAIARGHAADPTAVCISWDRRRPALTEPTITDQDLRDLYARHCECRPLDVTRGDEEHAALHDCDTAVLYDVQVALGIRLLSGLDSTTLQGARARCATVINEARRL